MYVLEVISGPRDGMRWEFARSITIGRDETLVDACIAIDRYLSRKHAELRAEGDAFVLTDLTSRNGTKIDGRSVSVETLASGARFTVGRTIMRVAAIA